MDKKDVLEIKRRLNENACTFTRMCGCYVDAERNKITKINETFLNLDEAEYLKYLDIARKVLSGKRGDNLLELEFPLAEESAGGSQQFLMGLRESRLKNDDLLDTFYDMVIDSYNYVGNYLILVFHDAYDVMTKTSDNDELDESEEVYEYLLCAICPVNLSKPGLGYRADENRIEPRIRDWVVGVPDTGFVFPAFTDRSTDIHAAMFYTRDVKHSHSEFMESGLGCKAKMTATEKKMAFQEILNAVIGEDEESRKILNQIHGALNDVLIENAGPELDNGEDESAVELTQGILKTCLNEVGLPEDQKNVILNSREELLPADTFVFEVVDEKAVEEANNIHYIADLKELLAAAADRLESADSNEELVREIRRKI